MSVANGVKLTSYSRREVEARALDMMVKVRTRLIMEYPMYGALIARLKLRVDWRAKTMYTDARVIGYNPEFVATRSFSDLLYIDAHEVTHCALGHPMRTRDKMHRDCWGEAIDHVTNLILNRDPRLKMPLSGLADVRFTSMTAEEVYKILVEEKRAAQAKEDAQREEAAAQAKAQQDNAPPAQGGNDGNDNEGETAPGTTEGADEAGTKPGDAEAQPDAGPDDAAEPLPEGDASPDADGAPNGEGDTEQSSEDASIGEGSRLGDVIAPGEAGDFDDEEGDGFANQSSAENSSHDENGEAGTESADGDEKIESPKGDEATDQALMRDWQEAVAIAVIAQGDGAAEAFQRIISAQVAPRMNYEEVLERFCSVKVQVQEDWSRPNRRFADIYMPSLGGIGIPVMVFGVDTSASITDAVLGMMHDSMQRIAAQGFIKRSVVVFCDSAIRNVEEYEGAPMFEKAPGGGGTRFGPVFEYAQQLIEAGQEVAGVIYLTDQEGSVSNKELYEHIPTLWVNPGKATEPPFGEVVSMLT